MRPILKYIILSAAISLLIAMTSCDHKEILYPGTEQHEINVMFMWDDSPEASPDGMTVYFFPINNRGKIWRYDIPGRDGGTVSLPVGSYNLLAYNNDLPGVTFSGLTSLSSSMASAVVNGGISRGTGDLYAAVINRLDVTPCGVTYITHDGYHKECRQGLVRCFPEKRFCNYRIVVRDVVRIELIRKASVSIPGVAGAISLASDKPADEPVTMSASVSTVGNNLEGSSTAFGLAPSTGRIIARLNVTRTDGTVLEKEYDVTSQVIGAADPRNVTIYIDNIEIPSPDQHPGGGDDGGDVGITVGVDGWHVINIDITT